MKKIVNYQIASNEALTANVYKMVLVGDTSLISGSGKFLDLKVRDNYLRKPISIHDYDDKSVTIIYKTMGKGTKELSTYKAKEMIEALVPLGNGYTLNEAKSVVLIGGGVGVPPLYHLAKELLEQKKEVKVVLGFNKADEIFLSDEFAKLGCEVLVTTVDGSVGIKGFVSDALKTINYDYFYACGPKPMLKALQGFGKGQVSLEEKMGCGFGACMGCTIKTKKGNKRVCHDGPVFESEDIIWED